MKIFCLVLFLALLLVMTIKYIKYSKKCLYMEVLDSLDEYLNNIRHTFEHIEEILLIQRELTNQLTITTKEMSDYFLPGEFEETENQKEKDLENAIMNNIDIYDGTESGQDDLKKYM